jgi:uncharacterized membrane protein YdbT with pleckstrin-like domain
MAVTTLKPHKQAFIWYNIFLASLSAFGTAGASLLFVLFTFEPSLLIFPLGIFIISVIGVLFGAITRFIVYSKEEYVIHSDKIIRKGGGLFSDTQNELLVKNITHLKLSVPYVENKLFSTGSIAIESAGSSGVEIRLQSLDSYEETYRQLQDMLVKAGFNITREDLLQQESPSLLALVIDSLNFLIQSAFSLIFLIVFVAGFVEDLLSIIPSQARVVLILAAIVLFTVGAVAWFIWRFLELRYRSYEIYNDTVSYREGFFNKNFSLLPAENLADSYITQNFLQRLFGIYDVRISTRGSGKEIVFANMAHGELMESNIDEIVANSKNNRHSSREQTTAEESAKSSVTDSEERSDKQKYSPETLFSTEIDLTKSIVGAVWLQPLYLLIIFVSAILIHPAILFAIILFLPGVIFAVISAVIRVIVTKYYVKSNSIRSTFKLFSVRNQEFSLDKVTLLTIKKSIIDHLFNTNTIEFRSIGSAENIIFHDVREDKQMQSGILTQLDMHTNKEELTTLNPQFSVGRYLVANTYSLLSLIIFIITAAVLILLLNLSIVWFIILLIAAALIVAISLIYSYYFQKTAELRLYSQFFYYEEGILVRTKYYAPLNYIKDIETTKYPFSHHGSLKFNIAGEQIVTEGNQGNQQPSFTSNSFVVKYLADIENLDQKIDKVMFVRPSATEFSVEEYKSWSQKKHLSAKPALSNTLIPGMVFIIFPPILILVFLRTLQLYFVSYELQSDRIIRKSGVIYRRQMSILYKQIDFINSYQGLFNKIFDNGTLTINTEGSGKVEMFIINISEWQQFYEKLKHFYENA